MNTFSSGCRIVFRYRARARSCPGLTCDDGCMSSLLGAGAFAGALAFGFRHGFDWDHLAALTDLTGSQTSRRRSMWLGTLYAFGHAAMVLFLGAVAVLFGQFVSAGLDAALGRVVGVSLVGLGLWMAWTIVRTRGAAPMRSRQMLLVDAFKRLISRIRRPGETVVIDHDHPHDHDRLPHQHSHRVLTAQDAVRKSVAVGHSHAHRHTAQLPDDPFRTSSQRSAFGIGVLHGIGAETPTQVLIFAAAANATGKATSTGLLAFFVVGLVAANTVVTAASTFGFQRLLRHRIVVTAVGGVTMLFSLVIGIRLLLAV